MWLCVRVAGGSRKTGGDYSMIGDTTMSSVVDWMESHPPANTSSTTGEFEPDIPESFIQAMNDYSTGNVEDFDLPLE